MNISKKIILIRHAESQNNVAKKNVKSGWRNIKKLEFKLPTKEQLLSTTSILKVEMNSELSQDGEYMVINLHKKIIETDFIINNKVELIVHSNLIRAKNTCNGCFHDSNIEIIQNDHIYERSISEHLYNDIEVRINNLKKWLLNRSENCIVVVGHSAFFKRMLKSDRIMKNCEVCECELFSNENIKFNKILISGGESLIDDNDEIINKIDEFNNNKLFLSNQNTTDIIINNKT